MSLPELPTAVFQDLVSKTLDLIGPGNGQSCLDVGAGSGYFSLLLHDQGFIPSACDISSKRFLVDDIPFKEADIDQGLPYDDDSFDMVVSIEVVEHIPNHARFFEELIRVTKPGGRIVVTTPNIQNMSSRWDFFIYGYNQAAPFPIDPRLKDITMEHINPIALPQIMFYAERFGANLIELGTNRRKKGAGFMALIMFPLLYAAMRIKFLHKRNAKNLELRREHMRWVLSLNNLMGRMTIAVLRKQD